MIEVRTSSNIPCCWHLSHSHRLPCLYSRAAASRASCPFPTVSSPQPTRARTSCGATDLLCTLMLVNVVVEIAPRDTGLQPRSIQYGGECENFDLVFASGEPGGIVVRFRLVHRSQHLDHISPEPVPIPTRACHWRPRPQQIVFSDAHSLQAILGYSASRTDVNVVFNTLIASRGSMVLLCHA